MWGGKLECSLLCLSSVLSKKAFLAILRHHLVPGVEKTGLQVEVLRASQTHASTY